MSNFLSVHYAPVGNSVARIKLDGAQLKFRIDYPEIVLHLPSFSMKEYS